MNTAIGFATVNLLFPTVALAHVQITEIMYDSPGNDDGAEWIEVTNTGTGAVDISKYKLNESGSNHGFRLVAGSALIAPGQSAIVASDASKFAGAWPRYSGVLFDSAFSLSNSGETLVLKDASSTVVDTAVYQTAPASSGTGGTLHLNNGAWVPAQANPGIYPGELISIASPAKVVASAPAPSKKSFSKKSVIPDTTSSASAAPNSLADASVSDNQPSVAAGAALAPALPSGIWILGVVAIALLGIAGAYLVRTESHALGAPANAKEEADTFEIE